MTPVFILIRINNNEIRNNEIILAVFTDFDGLKKAIGNKEFPLTTTAIEKWSSLRGNKRTLNFRGLLSSMTPDIWNYLK